jgi:hypothetical protein
MKRTLALRACLSTLALTSVGGVGHYPMLEKPAELNAKLRVVLGEFAAGR